MFDSPIAKRITAEINAQIKGLSNDQAFATLTQIITDQVDRVDEAAVRVSCAYHQIESSALWTARFTSEVEWRNSLEKDVDSINQRGRQTMDRITRYAEKIRKNWDIALETVAPKASKGLAESIAKFSTICPYRERALELMSSCNLSRQQEEPKDRGPGVSRTDRLLPIDVRNATTQYREAEAIRAGTSQTSHPVNVPHSSGNRSRIFKHPTTQPTFSGSEITRAKRQTSTPHTSIEATPVERPQNQIEHIINQDSLPFDMPYSDKTQLSNFAHLTTQNTPKDDNITQAMRRMSEPQLAFAATPQSIDSDKEVVYAGRHATLELEDAQSQFHPTGRDVIEEYLAIGKKRQSNVPEPRFRKKTRPPHDSNPDSTYRLRHSTVASRTQQRSLSPEFARKGYTPLGETYSLILPAFASEPSYLSSPPLASPPTNNATDISPLPEHERLYIPSSSSSLSSIFELPTLDERTPAQASSSDLLPQPTIGKFGVAVSVSSLDALKRGEMIDDSIIMGVLGLLDTSGCVVVDPLTLDSDHAACPAPSFSRRIAARESGLIVVPYHNKAVQHWSLFIARPTVELLEHIDSHFNKERTNHDADKVCEHLNRLIGEDVRWKRRNVNVTSSISNDYQHLANLYQRSAQQTNSVDCGIYLIANASTVMECSPLPGNIDTAALRLNYAQQIEKTLKPQTTLPHGMTPLGRSVLEKNSTINQVEAEIETAISQILKNHIEVSTNKMLALKDSALQAESTYANTRKEVIIAYNEKTLQTGEETIAKEALIDITDRLATCSRLRQDLAGPVYENIPDVIGQMLTIAEKEFEQYTEEAKKQQLNLNKITEQLRAAREKLSVARQRCLAAGEARANAVAASATARSDLERVRQWTKSEYPKFSNM